MENKDYVEVNPEPYTEEERKALQEQAKRMAEARIREREKHKKELRAEALAKHEAITKKREDQIKQGMVGFTDTHKEIFREMRTAQDERNWMFRKGTAGPDKVLKEGTKEFEFQLLKKKLLSLPLDYGRMGFVKKYWYDGGSYRIEPDSNGKLRVRGFGVPAKLILDENGEPKEIELKVPCTFLKDAYFTAKIKVK